MNVSLHKLFLSFFPILVLLLSVLVGEILEQPGHHRQAVGDTERAWVGTGKTQTGLPVRLARGTRQASISQISDR